MDAARPTRLARWAVAPRAGLSEPGPFAPLALSGLGVWAEVRRPARTAPVPPASDNGRTMARRPAAPAGRPKASETGRDAATGPRTTATPAQISAPAVRIPTAVGRGRGTMTKISPTRATSVAFAWRPFATSRTVSKVTGTRRSGSSSCFGTVGHFSTAVQPPPKPVPPSRGIRVRRTGAPHT